MHTHIYKFVLGLICAAAAVPMMASAGCITASEEEKQAYALASQVAGEIYESGTAPQSIDAAIVRDAARLAVKSAGPPQRQIGRDAFLSVAGAAEHNIESGFWATPLGDAVNLALLAVGMSGIGQGLVLLRRKTRIFQTVVEAIDTFADDHPRAAKDLKRVIGEKATAVKGFNRAVEKAKGK